MSGRTPSVGMVLAAGLGTRMRPLTWETPKPLLPVAGRSMLDRALDALVAAGVPRAVVNVHWLAEQIEARCAERHDIAISVSDEQREVMETGGGLVAARGLLGEGPVFVANADILWTDGPGGSALRRLAGTWDDAAMDALLLVHPTDAAHGYDGAGDFLIAPDGRLSRRGERGRAPLVFTGVQIVHTRLLDGAPPGPFSLNVLYDRALANGRLFGLVHDGSWYHVGTPEALAETDRKLREEEG